MVEAEVEVAMTTPLRQGFREQAGLRRKSQMLGHPHRQLVKQAGGGIHESL